MFANWCQCEPTPILASLLSSRFLPDILSKQSAVTSALKCQSLGSLISNDRSVSDEPPRAYFCISSYFLPSLHILSCLPVAGCFSVCYLFLKSFCFIRESQSHWYEAFLNVPWTFRDGVFFPSALLIAILFIFLHEYWLWCGAPHILCHLIFLSSKTLPNLPHLSHLAC